MNDKDAARREAILLLRQLPVDARETLVRKRQVVWLLAQTAAEDELTDAIDSLDADVWDAVFAVP